MVISYFNSGPFEKLERLIISFVLNSEITKKTILINHLGRSCELKVSYHQNIFQQYSSVSLNKKIKKTTLSYVMRM